MSEILALDQNLPILIQSFLQNRFPNPETSIQPLMYHPKKLQLRNQIPLKQKPFHLRKKRILTRIFHRKISNLLTIPKKIRLPEKRKVPTTTFSIQQRN